MSFQFGFASEDGDDENAASGGVGRVADEHVTGAQIQPVQKHKLADLLSALPDHLSYTTLPLGSPTGRTVSLPRRELFDVRMQLLGESDSRNDDIVDQLDQSDLRSGIYEGGFKTWECSQDLASLLLDRGPRKDIDELVRCDLVVELGAGTALPSLVLFRHALLNAIPMTFVLADYNDAVLRLVTLPNIFLTWVLATDNAEKTSEEADSSSQGELEISETLKESFLHDLHSKGINLVFLSGPWSASLAAQIPQSAPDMGTLILAAETIYSPASTLAFVDLLVNLLKRIKMAKAMIGAKRVYFGVGGSVDGLKEACREQGAVAYEIENHGVPGMDSGVGRALIEVQMY